MTPSAPKGSATMASLPKSLWVITVSVGGLAMFLMVASCLLISYPIGSKVRVYFYGVDSARKVDLVMPSFNESRAGDSIDKSIDKVTEVPPSKPLSEVDPSSKASSVNSGIKERENHLNYVPLVSPGSSLEGQGKPNPVINEVSKNAETNMTGSLILPKGSDSSNSTAKESSSVLLNGASGNTSVEIGCDLYQGSWSYDSLGPLYTNNTCPVLTQMQNCQGNGRPDKEYENWRWKPSQCNLPRFDGKKFLELMRGKTLAFIGDSVARNQMESMLCILWQVEVPKNRGNRRMQRWYFRSTSVMIVRMWSSWLVHQNSEPVDFAPAGVTKLHLDAPDDAIMEFLPQFDVVVLSSGHWFAKQSVYVLNNKIVGGQLWWPDKSRKMKVNNIEAFGISVETILSAIITHPNYTGLTILRSYSPDHYEGGAWNTGGSCTGKVQPLSAGELVENGFTNIMHEKQVTGFNRAVGKATNKSKLILMDITKPFEYRHDGHPGPYRSPDPNKITKRGPDGRPPPQDCLHWCMPGPVDTWNEIVLEIIRREFEGDSSS